jgi:D-alanyl-lipoteichoic acid acyltransferase DltB (MBOAT superfamily)
MLFNSVDFVIFLPIVFIFYWFITYKNLKLQNLLIVVASYFFYGWWDWRFLTLIFLSTIVDYSVGIGLNNENNLKKRKILLLLSISVNLGLLLFFKYFNFFTDSFVIAFTFLGIEFKREALNIVLPVGISFYTFQTLSYSIDIYKRKLNPTKDFIVFAAFVSFFPQLVAGPIERATNLLPQFKNKRIFSQYYAIDGLRQILWGLFKKIVIADNCAEFTNIIFNNSTNYSGSTLVLGALFFSFQIYGDFSGYSDIAIGTSRLFGFKLMRNFAFPYFSRNIGEFWRRWHISLSTWFRDYLYIPLGGSHCKTSKKIRNIFIIFIVSGFWHGANWTFIAWGTLHAIYFLPLLLLNKNRLHLGIVAEGRKIPSLKEIFEIILTFSLTVLAWIFFRARSLDHAFEFLSGIFSKTLFSTPYFPGIRRSLGTIIFVLFFVIIEWLGRENEYAIAQIGIKWFRPFRWIMYYGLILIIFYFAGKPQDFIYFQF